MIPAGKNSFRLQPVSLNGQSAARARTRMGPIPASAA
jgi:hypothetical protein